MNEKEFRELCIEVLVKALQNNKALFSTTLHDGKYYECTFNGDRKELYVDCYIKLENVCVKIGE